MPVKQCAGKTQRVWLFRILAMVLAPVLFLIGAELVLRLFSVGFNPDFFVPVPGRGLLTGNEQYGQRFFPAGLTQPPIRFAFPARKEAGTFRVFVLGSSAAAGVPAVAFSFSRILEVMLEEAFPGRKFEVINTAMVAINSHVVREIARESARYEPDLFVVFTGNNEVVGPYGAGTIFRPLRSLPAIRAEIRFGATRVGQLLRRLGGLAPAGASSFEAWKGMEMFLGHTVSASDPRLPPVYAHIRANLAAICDAARRGGAEVALCTVPTNLGDCPPFASLNGGGVAGRNRDAWDGAYRRGMRAEEQEQWPTAARAYEEAAALDGAHAELQYRLARCLLELGRDDEARARFVMARDADALRFRADTAINRSIRDAALTAGAILVDAEAALAAPELTPRGLPGRQLFHEHCHLTFRGNYAFAAAVFRGVADRIANASPGGGSPAPAPPPIETCAERLAFTAWDQRQAAARIVSMTSRPPFTNQLGHEAQQGRRRLAVAAMDRDLTPGRLAASRETYERAVARRPADILLRLGFVRLLNRLEDYPAAEAQWRRLVALLPSDAGLHYNWGTALLRLGRPGDAERALRDALRIRPAYAEAHANLALALSGQGRMDEAIRECRRALRCNPKHAAAQANLAKLLKAGGRTEIIWPAKRESEPENDSAD